MLLLIGCKYTKKNHIYIISFNIVSKLTLIFKQTDKYVAFLYKKQCQ